MNTFDRLWQRNQTQPESSPTQDNTANTGDTPPSAYRSRTASTSPEHFDSILQSMGGCLIVVGTSGRIETVNPAALDMLGYEADELIGQPLEFVFAQGTFRGSGLETLYERGIMRRGDKVFRAKDGRNIHVFYSGSVLRDPDGQVQGIVCVAHDATERKRMETALRESESRYRNVIEHAGDIILSLSPEGVFTSLNPAFETVTGWSSAEWVGKNYTALIHPDDVETAQTLFKRVLSGEALSNTPVNILSQSGKKLVVEITASPLRADGKLTHILCIARDITVRREAENQLGKYIQQLNLLRRVDKELTSSLSTQRILMLALDTVLRLTDTDTGYIALVEGDQIRPTAIVGYPQVLDKVTRFANTGIIARAVKRMQSEWIEDVTQDPAYRVILSDTRSLMVFPLLSRDHIVGVINLETNRANHFTEELFRFLNIVAGRIAIALDNAVLFELTQQQLGQLQELYDQVSELEKRKTAMMRMAAHDLRNPLSAATMAMTLLHMAVGESFTDQAKDYFQRIERALGRMKTITSDILSVERIEQQGQADLSETIDLAAVTKQVFANHQDLADQKRQQYHLFTPDTPVQIQANSAQLREAMENLISNAIKYTPEDGSVTVQLRQRDKDVLFAVEDTGYGIPQHLQEGLFQPFYRAQSDETKDIEGTGLGLHLVKSVIEQHNGTVRFRSTQGKGSTFGFQLPLKQESESEPPPAPPERPQKDDGTITVRVNMSS